MVEHVLHRDLRGVGVAKDDHPKGVSDEQKIESAIVEQARRRKIVGGEAGNATA